jgi:hypothetical protein
LRYSISSRTFLPCLERHQSRRDKLPKLQRYSASADISSMGIASATRSLCHSKQFCGCLLGVYLDPANNSKGLLYQVRIAAATFNAHKRWVKTDSLYPQHKRRPIPISPSFLDFPASFKMRGWLIDRKTSGGPRRMLCFDCLRAQFPI